MRLRRLGSSIDFRWTSSFRARLIVLVAALLVAPGVAGTSIAVRFAGSFASAQASERLDQGRRALGMLRNDAAEDASASLRLIVADRRVQSALASADRSRIQSALTNASREHHLTRLSAATGADVIVAGREDAIGFATAHSTDERTGRVTVLRAGASSAQQLAEQARALRITATVICPGQQTQLASSGLRPSAHARTVKATSDRETCSIMVAAEQPSGRAYVLTAVGALFVLLAGMSAVVVFVSGRELRRQVSAVVEAAEESARAGGRRSRHGGELAALRDALVARTAEATQDELTGLANVRQFRQVLKHALSTSDRQVGVILMDVDNFKQVNDTRGHLQGDEVLRSLGAVIGGQLRAGEIAARYGGEELAVVLPDTTEHEAFAAADRLRKLISATSVDDVGGGEPMHVTVSVGVAVAAESGERDMRQLVEAADQAMYTAKRSGKNRTRMARRRTIAGAGRSG